MTNNAMMTTAYLQEKAVKCRQLARLARSNGIATELEKLATTIKMPKGRKRPIHFSRNPLFASQEALAIRVATAGVSPKGTKNA